MPCYRPITAYRGEGRTKNGKTPIYFNPRAGYHDRPVQLPCGKCIGCKMERARQWAVRIMHEASLHEDNCFITLTYDDDNIPDDKSLLHKDVQDFFKRLRKSIEPKKIRYFACGEYGEKLGRPHYHAILFGIDFDDKKKYSDGENTIETSEKLSEIWGKGHVSTGEVNDKTASYVAQYCTKKVYGEDARNHYTVINYETGEYLDKKPEYVVMSRRPGIAKEWIEKYKSGVLRDDSVIIKGRPYKPPRYYDKQLEISHPDEIRLIKMRRLPETDEPTDHNRLRVKEIVAEKTLKIKGTRRLENGKTV